MATVASLPLAAYLRGSSDRSRDDDKALPDRAAGGRSPCVVARECAQALPASSQADAAGEQRARRLIEAWTSSAGARLAQCDSLSRRR